MTKKRVNKSTFSVAMSKDTGCLVMVRTNGTQVTVVGYLSKDESMGMANALLSWSAEAVSVCEPSRAAYPH